MITVHEVREPRTQDISPFTDQTKRGQHVVIVKGAPDVVLDLCTHYQTMDNASVRWIMRSASEFWRPTKS